MRNSVRPVGPSQNGIRAVFVVGLPRSGTTLLGNILDQHPKVFRIGESHFFEEIYPRLTKTRKPYSDEDYQTACWQLYTAAGRHRGRRAQTQIEKYLVFDDLLQSALIQRPDPAGIYQLFIELLGQKADLHLICDDTPRHVYHLDVIQSLSRASVINLVRDPRDFLISYKRYWQTASKGERERIKRLYHPVNTSLYWRSGINQIGRYSELFSTNRARVLKYEDLVSHPESNVRELCEVLAIPFDSAMLKIEDSNSSFRDFRGGISSKSVGRWPRHLTAEERWICELIAGPHMPKYGYIASGDTRINIPRLLGLFATSVPSFIRAVWINRQRTGSISEYLIRRVLGLISRE